MQFELNEREAEILHNVLAAYLPQFREEISKTENFDWRQAMKRDEEVIKALIGRLEAGVLRPGAGTAI